MGRVFIEVSKEKMKQIKELIRVNLYIEKHNEGHEPAEPQAELANFETVISPKIQELVNEYASFAVTQLENKIIDEACK